MFYLYNEISVGILYFFKSRCLLLYKLNESLGIFRPQGALLSAPTAFDITFGSLETTDQLFTISKVRNQQAQTKMPPQSNERRDIQGRHQ